MPVEVLQSTSFSLSAAGQQILREGQGRGHRVEELEEVSAPAEFEVRSNCSTTSHTRSSLFTNKWESGLLHDDERRLFAEQLQHIMDWEVPELLGNGDFAVPPTVPGPWLPSASTSQTGVGLTQAGPSRTEQAEPGSPLSPLTPSDVSCPEVATLASAVPPVPLGHCDVDTESPPRCKRKTHRGRKRPKGVSAAMPPSEPHQSPISHGSPQSQSRRNRRKRRRSQQAIEDLSESALSLGMERVAPPSTPVPSSDQPVLSSPEVAHPKKKRRRGRKHANKSAAAQERSSNFVSSKIEGTRAEEAQAKVDKAAGKEKVTPANRNRKTLRNSFRHKLFAEMQDVQTNVNAEDFNHETTAFCAIKKNVDHVHGIAGPDAGKVLFGDLDPNVHPRVHELLQQGYTYVCAPEDGWVVTFLLNASS